MEVAIPEPLERFVKQAVREGRYASESEVVSLGIRMVKEQERKLAALRARIQASLEDTREVSDEEMDEVIEQRAKELLAQGIPW
jgi:antitoxin ParD1/3/4